MKIANAGRLALVCWLLFAGGVLEADPPPSDPQNAEGEEAASQAPELDTKALAELGLEHSRARDELLAVEARLSLLSEKVFGSRLSVRYEGDCETPFRITRIELDLDGALAYRQEFEKAPSIQSIKLFDGFLPPGRHVLQLRLWARGPDDPEGSEPGYFAGSGMAVHLRDDSVCTATFEGEQDGDSPGDRVSRESEPGGDWDIEISATFETEKN